MVIKKGDKIKVEYEGRFEDGTVFDNSEKHGSPLEFKAGTGMVVPGFDGAVIGMNVNEEKEFTLKPEDAYGQPNPQGVQKVPKDKFPSGAEVGMMIGIPLPNDQQAPAKIVAMDEKEITIDMNHPLAGKILIFKIKIVGIE